MRRIILALMLVCCSVLASPAFAEPIGKVVAVVGAPSAKAGGKSRPLTPGSGVFENDVITVSSGNAQIELVDGTKLVVGPSSSLLIDRALLRSPGALSNLSIDALRGTFRFITGASAKSAYNIKTANATIGIRGTGFDFWVADRTGVAVLKGLVRLCGGGSCVMIPANCTVGIAGRGETAKLLLGAAKSLNIKKHLPFIEDQSSLRQRFRLNTRACNVTVKPDVGQGSKFSPEGSPRPSRQGDNTPSAPPPPVVTVVTVAPVTPTQPTAGGITNPATGGTVVGTSPNGNGP